jgi:hypothetical protein
MMCGSLSTVCAVAAGVMAASASARCTSRQSSGGSCAQKAA